MSDKGIRPWHGIIQKKFHLSRISSVKEITNQYYQTDNPEFSIKIGLCMTIIENSLMHARLTSRI